MSHPTPDPAPLPTLLFEHDLFLAHNPGDGHPERPARLASILDLLAKKPVEGTEVRAARAATIEELRRVHSPVLVEAMMAISGHRVRIDPDTATSEQSVKAALHAAGGAIDACVEVLEGRAKNAFAFTRPPGHHAEPNRAMGFCLFNNAAIAAEAALAKGLSRVAILDWDVHHGNGTQDAFFKRRDVMYLSVHQHPFYPGTGAAYWTGEGDGEGFNVNAPLPEGCADGDYRAVFEDLFLPVLSDYRPELLIVSAGFDAHRADPLGGMLVTERGFAAMCTSMRKLAENVCGGRLVLMLEGGYDLSALADSTHACVEVLRGRSDDFSGEVSAKGAGGLAESVEVQRKFWKGLGKK